MVNSDWDARKCPSCNSAQIPSSAVISSRPKAETLNFEELKNYFIGLRENQIFFSYFRCENCFLLYCPWYFSDQQLQKLYSDMPDNLLGEDKSVISRTQSGYVKQISKKISQVETYLEIGPDIGLVTSAVVKRFYPNTVLLFEPNLSVHSQLEISAQPAQKIKIYSGTLYSESYKPDLTVGVHVYDHLLAPLLELTNLFKFSADRSTIAIVVHNEKSLLRKILGKKWPPFCLQHPQLYNRKTLKDLLERAGWQKVEFRSTVNWFSLDHFIKTGASILGLSPKYFSYLPKIQIPFRLGNMICFAEKL